MTNGVFSLSVPVINLRFTKPRSIPFFSGVVEIPEAPEVRHERGSEGIEATELYGESLECSNSTMK